MSAVAIASMFGGCAGTSGACGGDCDGSDDVTVDEMISMGNIAAQRDALLDLKYNVRVA